MRIISFVIGIILLSYTTYAQVSPEKKANLSSTALDETSGMIFWNGKVYVHMDGGNTPHIFEIDSATGVVIKTIHLDVPYDKAVDDWEDITQDETYIYIGNFGNNANGSRKDLKFYRVLKQAITNIVDATGTVGAGDIDVINFSYPDQTTFCPVDFTCASAANNTAFDCEAVIYDNGFLHLFTKDWVSSTKTVHYSIPAIPGTHEATRLEEFNTEKLLITAATKISNKVIALLGYENPTATLTNFRSPECKLWLIMGFSDMNHIFTTADKITSVKLGTFIYFPFPPRPNDGMAQQEAIAAVKDARILIAGERFKYAISSPINASWDVPAQLYAVDLSGVIPSNMILSEGISNFVSRTSDNTVVLNWDYSDSGAGFFEIQVSATGDNDDFKTIGKINANNNALQTYSFSYNNSSAGKAYFRIKVTTLNGRALFSNIIFVKNNEENGFNLKASPSLFTGRFAVSFYSSSSQQIQLCLADAYGRTVINRQLKASPGNYNFVLDGLTNLSRGVYFLTCRTKDNVFVKKVMKQ